MDEHLTDVIKEALDDYRGNVDEAQDKQCLEAFVSLRVEAADYRKDPFPRGKSKYELIDTITATERKLDQARLLLRSEHTARIGEVYGITMEHHCAIDQNCEVCRFLEETSLVRS